MAITIAPEPPDSPAARVLIDELTAYLTPLSPPESRHGYDVEKLIARQVTFFILRCDGEPAGCGGIELVGSEYGEIKRMYVLHPFTSSPPHSLIPRRRPSARRRTDQRRVMTSEGSTQHAG